LYTSRFEFETVGDVSGCHGVRACDSTDFSRFRLPLDREKREVNKQARRRGLFPDVLSFDILLLNVSNALLFIVHPNLDINMSCIVPECTAAESSRLEKVSGHDYDPILQDLDEYELCDEHRCRFSTKSRNNRCTDIVAQGPVELHSRARKGRPTTTDYCKTHFGQGEQKRKGESENRPSRAKKVVVEEDAVKYLYLRGKTPPAKPTIEGMQYTLEAVRSLPLPTFLSRRS
jgi:hypothetical protein